jgi:hypothetical protein
MAPRTPAQAWRLRFLHRDGRFELGIETQLSIVNERNRHARLIPSQRGRSPTLLKLYYVFDFRMRKHKACVPPLTYEGKCQA